MSRPAPFATTVRAETGPVLFNLESLPSSPPEGRQSGRAGIGGDAWMQAMKKAGTKKAGKMRVYPPFSLPEKAMSESRRRTGIRSPRAAPRRREEGALAEDTVRSTRTAGNASGTARPGTARPGVGGLGSAEQTRISGACRLGSAQSADSDRHSGLG